MALTFANKVTIVRILIVPFFIACVLYYTPEREFLRWTVLGLFSLAVITDVVDGYIARTRHQKTAAGAILDPLADKILLISAFLCLFRISNLYFPMHFPVWLVVAVISRDFILLIGSMIIQVVQGKLTIEPTKWGKATTFFQIFSVFGLLIQWPYSIYIWQITFILTLISGTDYIRMGIKILNNGGK